MENKKFFDNIQKAEFIDRPNRFIINCRTDKKTVRTFLPNPGRLQELLFPECTIYITKNSDPSRKTAYTTVGVLKKGSPVMLHTHKTNNAVRYLLENKLVAPLKKTEVVRAEVPYKNSRFDFLLKKGKEKIYLEVKSCTLFGEKIAMFPDAVTERGRRHIEELAHISKEGIKTAVIFLINYDKAEFFMPDYHTDPEFAKTFLKCRNDVKFLPVSVKWNDDLTLSPETKEIKIPWKTIEEELNDRGCYLILLELKKKKDIKIGSLGNITFDGGYYVYIGSAMKNLTQRIKRHSRLRKNHHWHIDYLRQETNVLTALPVRASEDLECELAKKVAEIADFSIPEFGSSDCKCKSHLLGFKKNPVDNINFVDIIQYFRIDRLYRKLRATG